MKSLEIVRDKLYILEKYPAKIEAVKLEKDVLINQEQLLKIEQDLEVLEIIINKNVDITCLEMSANYITYRCMVSVTRLTNKEYEKLKQWLEENEDE